MTVGVLVMTMADYLNNFWSQLSEAHELYDSVSASLTDKKLNRGAGLDDVGCANILILIHSCVIP